MSASDGSFGSPSNERKEPMTEIVEYLVKFKDLSYLHAEWVSEYRLVCDPNASRKLNSWLRKHELEAGIRHPSEAHDSEEDASDWDGYNPDFRRVERFVAVSTAKGGGPSAGGAYVGDAEGIAMHARGTTSPVSRVSSSPLSSPLRSPRALGPSASPGGGTIRYLVKWRGLPYSECTWERPEELPASAAYRRKLKEMDLRNSKPKASEHDGAGA